MKLEHSWKEIEQLVATATLFSNRKDYFALRSFSHYVEEMYGRHVWMVVIQAFIDERNK